MRNEAAEPAAAIKAVRPTFGTLLTAINVWLRRDGLAIAMYVVATLLMTYPLALSLGGQWLALRDDDTYVKLWDNWWLQHHAFSEPSLTFTDLQFHPGGLDLSYHSISWTVAFLTWGLTSISDAITAYNLTILVAIFSTAYAAYLLVRPFVRYRAAAWLAGAIYSFAPYHLAHSGGHPDLVHLAPIPLAILLLFAAVTRPSVLAAFGAALMVGLAGFTSLYIMVFALLTVAPVLLFLLVDKNRWAQPLVWRAVVLFILFSALLLSIRLFPILRDASALTEAIESKYTADHSQTDLLSYLLPSQFNPLFAPYTKEIALRLGHMSEKWPAYLGIVPLALMFVAITWKRQRKVVILWSSIGLMFVILSLGPVLRLNGKLYEDITLPAQFLSWLPPIRAVGRPDFFVLGVLLPLAVLAAFGFDRLLAKTKGRRRVQLALAIVIPGLLWVEYWSGEFPGVTSNASPLFEQLADDPDDHAIIQLPMGRRESKRYLFLQTIHHKPIVEGLSARTPAEAYQYVNNNALLSSWFRGKPLDCTTLSWDRFMAALDELINDDFRYVVVHNEGSEFPIRFEGYFDAEPVYQDSELTAFELTDLRSHLPCPPIYERTKDLPTAEVSTSVVWDEKIALIGYDLPELDLNAEALQITVYWQARRDMDDSYWAYFHLIDAESELLVAQADVVPRGWSYPTSWWLEGEVVEDTVQVPLEDVMPGHYELRIGWYDRETGMRLIPVSDQAKILSDRSVLLTDIRR